ncbi:hypothetical protein OAX78_04620, partial [Planctomycetota bacterium]|nr:hypothetical protein [Planctomycetota bacterium]
LLTSVPLEDDASDTGPAFEPDLPPDEDALLTSVPLEDDASDTGPAFEPDLPPDVDALLTSAPSSEDARPDDISHAPHGLISAEELSEPSAEAIVFGESEIGAVPYPLDSEEGPIPLDPQGRAGSPFDSSDAAVQIPDSFGPEAITVDSGNNPTVLSADYSEEGGSLALDESSGSRMGYALPPEAETRVDRRRHTDEIPIPTMIDEASGSGRYAFLFESDDVTSIPGLHTLLVSGEGDIEYDEDDDAPLPAEPKPSLGERLGNLWRSDSLWLIVALGGAALGPLFIAYGYDYYQLARAERWKHGLHDMLRAGGGMGLWFGICAAGLFLANLTYILRRRFGFLSRFISLRTWLNWHFVCGLVAGSLVLVHSGLLASNWIARTSSLAITVAVVSGVFGRYAISHLPRFADGSAADRGEVIKKLATLLSQLRQSIQAHPELRAAAIEALPDLKREDPAGLSSFFSLFMSDFRAARRSRQLQRRLKALRRTSDEPELGKAVDRTLSLVQEHAKFQRRLAHFESLQDLMDSWRALHLVLAIVVVSTMMLHVFNVTYYGALVLTE